MESKKIKRLMCSVITATLLLCELPGVAPMMESVGVVQEVEAASLKLSSKSVSVMTGEKSKITLKGVSSKKKKSVKWKSNSKNLVVSYSKKDTRNATFYARKAGTYKVTATYGKKTYVAVVKASKKGMNVTSRTLDKGQKYTLKFKGVKGKAKWSSSKKSVVTVKTIKNGKSAVITAKKPGSATITATVGKKKLVCVVKVKGTTAVVTPQPTTEPKPTENPKPQPTTSPKPTEAPNPTPTEAVKPEEKPTPEPTPVEVKANKITLNKENVTFTALNQTFFLSATVTPENAEEKAVGWNSNNMSVVTVDKDGKITAVGKGSAEVFCFLKSNGEVFAKCSVTVQIPDTQPEPTKPEPKPTEPEVVKVSGITLNPDISLKIEEGNSSKITATVVPSNATNNSVKWVSLSPDVATVDDNGNVTAIKAGSTTITCTAVDGSGVSAVCPVTVKAKSTTTNPSEQDKTDPTYTFKVSTVLSYGTKFEGGDLIDFDITTNAPIDKINIVVSNSILQYNTVFVNPGNYEYGFYARKEGKCTVSIYLAGEFKKSWDVEVTSDDKNWATYESWLNGVLENIKGSNSDFDKLDPIQKVTMLGQYILDNYDYNPDANKSFHNDGCGNCNASAFVLKDFAQRYLKLDAQVVNPSYWASNTSHVVARVAIGDKYYDFDASAPGIDGKAGNRGDVVVMVLDK